MRLIARTERVVLELLESGSERYGLELVGLAHGALKRGTVYVTLGRMEEKALIESRQEPPPPGAIGLPRRLYRITPLGLRVLETAQLVDRMLVAAPAS